jgi:autotransporter-associated beta strand protein
MRKNYVILFLTLFVGINVFSQTTYFWRSEATSGDWNVSTNWWDGSTTNVPAGNEIISFDNNVQTSMTNNLASTSRYRIFFTSSATTSRTIGGSTTNTFFDFSSNNQKIENNSSATHTINFPFNVGNNVMEINPVDGSLTFGGDIGNGGFNILVFGNNGHTLTFNGILSGSGNLSIEENSTVVMNAAATMSGTTTVKAGTLQLNASMASSDITVNSGATLQISEDATISSLTVDAGGIVIVDAGKELNISGNLSNSGSSFTVNSGSSLRVGGTSSGDITYNRNLATTNWYLVGIPVEGETIEDLISNNSFASGTGSNIGLAPYDNSQATAADRWDYQTAASTGSLTSGGGYSVKLASSGDITFTGAVEVDDVPVSITSGAGNAFNLLGNPYASFVAANSNADGSNNLLTINTSDLTENTLWFWDQGTSSYDQINQASAAFYVAPGQGFFVESTGSNTFDFTEAMQSHQSSDSFQRSTNTRPEILLVMTDGTMVRDADIFYIDGTTTGFDNGFDSSIFGGASNAFAIYTHLVSDSAGQKLGIQSLPDGNFENMIIPVGINATSGMDITISANAFNMPSGINVYLEDKNDGSFTLLDSSSSFSTTLDSDLNGIGRFYLHTNTQPLSVDEVDLNNLSIYPNDNNELRIIGIQNGTAQVRMYNILGKQVLNTSFEGTGANNIPLPNVRTGIYIVQLETETGKVNKKVIIE